MNQRLIDANELFNTILKQEMWSVPDFVYDSIKKAPTVEAIPVEWLKDYEAAQGQEARLQEAIEDWRNENEQRQDS